MEKMNKCIKEMDLSGLERQKTSKNEAHLEYKKLSAGFKLKNHFNPETPKISKIPEMNKTQNFKPSKSENVTSYLSTESNP